MSLFFWIIIYLVIILKKIIRITDVCIAYLLVVIFAFVGFGRYSLPNNISAYSSKEIKYNYVYSVSRTDDAVVDYQNNQRVSTSECEIRLFGVIPVKTATLQQINRKTVAVSGESFGIKLYTDGVIIVGTRDVEAADGKCNPASQAGLEKGDIIVSINNVKMLSSEQVEEVFNDNNGKPYEVKVKRNGNYKTFVLMPVFSPSEQKYKVGIWVRDSTAGIGTITFYNPSNNSIAALGHPITDVDTNEIMPILNGEAVRADVTKLYKSTNGEAGSLCCDFTNDVIGTLTLNSQYGIYGKYTGLTADYPVYEVAPAQEVERGEAQVLCTLDASGPQLYSVEITRVSYRTNNGEKNLVIKVTDESLIEKTGGIVQGMSGSPIIQNGKLVGALTHVIVDNPEKGYGIFAEKMVEQSDMVAK